MNESRTTGASDKATKKPQKSAQIQPQKREAGGESRALVTWTIVMAVATWALAGITLWAVHEQGHDAAQLLSLPCMYNMEPSTRIRRIRSFPITSSDIGLQPRI